MNVALPLFVALLGLLTVACGTRTIAALKYRATLRNIARLEIDLGLRKSPSQIWLDDAVRGQRRYEQSFTDSVTGSGIARASAWIQYMTDTKGQLGA